MGQVLEFAPLRESPQPEEDVEHLRGQAHCAACRHEWEAAAPIGVDWLECPSCHLMKGRFMHPVTGFPDDAIWVCLCGCDVFRIALKEFFCVNCGTPQRF